MGIYDAFYGQSDVKLITVRHEQTTTYMADGYARVTGKPGVGLVVPGPGCKMPRRRWAPPIPAHRRCCWWQARSRATCWGRTRGRSMRSTINLISFVLITKWCERVLSVEKIPGSHP